MKMHPSFADWYRVVTVDPQPAVLALRWKAIVAAAKKASPDDVVALLRTFVLSDATEATCPAVLREALKNEDVAFVQRGNLHELRVLAGVLLRVLMETGASNSALSLPAALGLVAASFGSRASSLAEPEHLVAANRFVVEWGRGSRERDELTAFQGPSGLTRDRFNQLFRPLMENQTISSVPDAVFGALNENTTRLTTAMQQLASILKDLQQTSRQQDEELNLLAWLQIGFSRDLDVPFDKLGAQAVLVLPMEVADLIAFVPAPPHAATLVLQALRGSSVSISEELSIVDAVNASPRNWREKTAKTLTLGSLEELTPLLTGIRKSLLTDGATDWLPVFKKVTGLDAEQRYVASELAQQVLRERMFVQAFATT